MVSAGWRRNWFKSFCWKKLHKFWRVCFFVSVCVSIWEWVIVLLSWCWVIGGQKADILKIIKKHRLIACTAAPQHSGAVRKVSVWNGPELTHKRRCEHTHTMWTSALYRSSQASLTCLLTSVVFLPRHEPDVQRHASYNTFRGTWISIGNLCRGIQLSSFAQTFLIRNLRNIWSVRDAGDD